MWSTLLASYPRLLTYLRKCKHPLRAAFRTVDGEDYGEIATVDTEARTVLDLCWDDTGTDSLIATCEYDAADGLSHDSAVRVHGARVNSTRRPVRRAAPHRSPPPFRGYSSLRSRRVRFSKIQFSLPSR